MTSQHSALTSEESVDLRKIIETLLRRWWLIAAVLAISFIVSVGFSVLVQTPVYESSGSAGLPVASSDTQLGLTPSDYLALASSDTQLGLTPSDYLAL
ncbi:MAG: Wzz/FepE/Etk N-terminal domain-containing protein, partial [Chloroflexi bacterium]|nr:Wzz/FepE/Etk N-terminal domain-containing protein [Chloroflexota bacterium]